MKQAAIKYVTGVTECCDMGVIEFSHLYFLLASLLQSEKKKFDLAAAQCACLYVLTSNMHLILLHSIPHVYLAFINFHGSTEVYDWCI